MRTINPALRNPVKLFMNNLLVNIKTELTREMLATGRTIKNSI